MAGTNVQRVKPTAVWYVVQYKVALSYYSLHFVLWLPNLGTARNFNISLSGFPIMARKFKMEDKNNSRKILMAFNDAMKN
jgi:hypothetical protein